MSVKLEVREIWLMECLVRQLPVTELLVLLALESKNNNLRRAMAPDLIARQREILDKAAMDIQEIENEWFRRQGG